MELMKSIKFIISALALSGSLTACANEKSASPSEKIVPKVIINYDNQGDCSFPYSPVDFCDEHHIEEVRNALELSQPNFNKNYLVSTITERPEYHQKSIVVIDPVTGYFYPLPIDFFSGTPSQYDPEGKFGKIEYSLESNSICLTGDILVYRSIKSGKFCFDFDGRRFSGFETEYMN